MRFAAALLLLSPLLGAQDPPAARPLLVRGAKVYTVSGGVLESADLLVENGRFKAVGRNLPEPPQAVVVDAAGLVAIPALVDGASAILQPSESPAAGGAEQDVVDGLDLFDDEAARGALSSGVITACCVPGARGPVSGLAAVLRLGPGRPRVIKPQASLRFVLGVSPTETSSTAQRALDAKGLRQILEGAKKYRESWEQYRKDLEEYEKSRKPAAPAASPAPGPAPPKAPEPQDPPKPAPAPAASPTPAPELKKPVKPRLDRAQETLARCLDEKNPLPVRIEVHQVDAIEAALRLVDEFKLKAVLERVTEGWKVAELVARSKVPVIVGPVQLWGPARVEELGHSEANAALLSKAGADVSIASFGPRGSWRFLLEAGGVAVSRGLPRENALKAVTLGAAKHLGLNQDFGAISAGRVGDFLLLSGEPFEAGTRVLKTYSAGVEAYSAVPGPLHASPALPPAPSRMDAAPAGASILLRGGRIVPMSRAMLESGELLIAGDRLVAIDAKIEPPAGAEIIDLPAGSWVTPGFIDAHTQLGLGPEADEITDPVSPHLRAADGIRSNHPALLEAAKSGFTLAAVAPGDANVVGGRYALLRLNGARLDRALHAEAAGLKFSLGDDAVREDGEPTSRPGALALLRRHLAMKGEVADSAVRRREPCLVNLRRADDIARFAELRASFDLRAAIVHADEAVRAIPALRNGKLGVAFGPLTPASTLEQLETPGRLEREGIPVALIGDAPAAAPHQVRWMAAVAVRHGLSPDAALRALTVVPARFLGIETEVGSLEAGRRADVVVWSGDPLAPGTEAILVISGGSIVHRKPK